MKTAEVTIYVEITDVAALMQAGRQRVIDDGVAGDMEEAADIVADDNISAALRWLIDPGTLPGVTVLDSSCEITGGNDEQ